MRVGTTYLTIVNDVLRRLREGTMSNFSSPTAYQQMIMDMVNVVKGEVEDAYPWQALRDTYTVTTVVNTVSYAFTGAGDRGWVLDGWNNTSQWEIEYRTENWFNKNYFGYQSPLTGSVTNWTPNGFDASYDLKIDVYPKPTAIETLYFNLYVPQADLSATTDVPLVPPSVIVEGTLARALIERGDDQAQAQQALYQMMLSDVVAKEVNRQPEMMYWQAV